jgi:hypothetical protein
VRTGHDNISSQPRNVATMSKKREPRIASGPVKVSPSNRQLAIKMTKSHRGTASRRVRIGRLARSTFPRELLPG